MQRIFLFLYSGFFVIFAIKSMEYDHPSKLDRNTLIRAAEEAHILIPKIILKNSFSQGLTGTSPFSSSSREELESLCSDAENLLLNEPLTTPLWTVHQKLKNLMPTQTYCTNALYKIYFDALKTAYEKAYFTQKKLKNEHAIECIHREYHQKS